MFPITGTTMNRIGSKIAMIGLAAALIGLPSGCDTDEHRSSVVVYTSVDRPYSEPILQAFERQTGIRVRPVYDVEAAKTTGLVNRLLAEAEHPRADVFWNGEFAQTVLLKDEGVLAPYASPQSARIPASLRDPDGYWTGFGGRARVILINTDLLPPQHYPESLFDLVSDRFPGHTIGVAYPLFGTTATQAAALYAALGPDDARRFYRDLYERGVRVLDGNASVRDWVADGRLSLGLTDTDDACAAVRKGAAVKVLLPDQGRAGLGTLIIPNTVALVAGGPHPEQARALVDYLLSAEVEQTLMESGWFQIAPGNANAVSDCPTVSEIKSMQVNLNEVFRMLPQAKQELGELFVR